MGTILNISAVNHSTGELTSVAHGRATGDGPCVLYAPPGGAIPAGLSAEPTLYWLIVVDANNVQLASSSANANANIPVTFSGNGTLPLQLLLGIPYVRATTYVPNVAGSPPTPGSQVKSRDLNDIEDTLTALWNLLSGQAQSLFPAYNVLKGYGWFGDGSDGAAVFDGTTTVVLNGTSIIPSSGVYSLPRDICCTNMTINSGVTIVTSGFRIFCTGTLTNNGTISWNGNNAVGTAGGGGLSNAGPLGQGTAGGNGLTGAGAGNNGTNSSPTYPSAGTQSTTGGAGLGQTGGTCCGGAGGGNNLHNGGSTSTTGMTAKHGAAALCTALNGLAADGTQWMGGSGGGGGANTSDTSGGGGGGAGTIVIGAFMIAGTGIIEANGGAGAHGNQTGGGGGGGGGGVVLVATSVLVSMGGGVYATQNGSQTIQALGGAGGGQGGIVIGDGGAGGPGGSGVVLPYNLTGTA